MIEYSNPRMKAVIENWPSGGKRVTATFEIEQTARGERGTRTTTGATKKLTFASKVRIVDGSDGKIYMVELSRMYHQINIVNGTLHAAGTFFDGDPRYETLLKLFA